MMARGRALPWVFVPYAATTFLHFAHNAQYLTQYPHLPPSWSRADVYVAWCCLMVVGLLGYGLYRFGRRNTGLSVLGLYALCGFGGLLHYTRAPIAHHSAMMNVTIWAEAVAGALLLANVVMLSGVAPGSMPPDNRPSRP
ncbi:MAG TPA: hypothetical protein VNX02_10145 [Steroidobacteraceae bacterium]|nr:hypothetical protein [Steroidobacteraceae bacterium]